VATLVQAVRLALHYAETHLGVTDIFGEDVGPPLGGVFTATQGLKTAWNSPLDERGIVGTAMGIAYAGGRPVCEIQFCDYAFNTIDLLKVAGNQRWAGAANFPLPMVVMTPSGAGIRGSLYHSHSFESWASRLPGWKVVTPSNPLDAYGLMLAAVIDPNPVMVLLPKALLRAKGTPDERVPGEPADDAELSRRIDAPVGDRAGWEPDWPPVEEYVVPIGSARFARRGDGATVLSYGRHLPLCVEDRPPLDLPLRLARDLREHCPHRPAADRQRGHRGDQLRRAPAEAGDRRALLRPRGEAGATDGPARPRRRAEPGLRAGHGAATRRHRRRPAGVGDGGSVTPSWPRKYR
jgi:pyruvate/2-oxoglutarate/acetoin dehydrogenase E1 component